jgi:hypothetical protein
MSNPNDRGQQSSRSEVAAKAVQPHATPAYIPVWMWSLLTVSTLAVLATLLGLWWFIQGEVAASRELAARVEESQVAFRQLIDGSPNILDYMEKHTSKKDSQAWIDLNANLSSRYIKSQLDTLFVLRDAEKTDDQTRVAWAAYPDLVTKFVAKHQGVIRKIEDLCESDEKVFIPVLENGPNTLIDIDYREATRIVFLGLIQAIADRDAPLVDRRLHTIERLQSKFDYVGLSSASSELINGLHIALDAKLLSSEQRRYWSDRITESKARAASNRTQQLVDASSSVNDFANLKSMIPENLLPTMKVNLLRSIVSDRVIRRNAGNSAVEKWTRYYNDTFDCILTRLAILNFIDENKRLPNDLNEVRESSTSGLPLELSSFDYHKIDDAKAELVVDPDSAKVELAWGNALPSTVQFELE